MKRVVLLSVLALEGIGGILGGSLLMAAPDGQLMKMPVKMMNGVFQNFFIPGTILATLGILNLIAFAAVLLRSKIDWILAGIALVGFTIWFAVEITILQELHWLHVVWGTPVLIGIWCAIPLIPKERISGANKLIWR